MSATDQRRKRFRVLRAGAELTQREVAKKAKIGLDRYWRIENGWVDPTPAEIANLSRVFKCELREVLPGSASSEAVA